MINPGSFVAGNYDAGRAVRLDVVVRFLTEVLRFLEKVRRKLRTALLVRGSDGEMLRAEATGAALIRRLDAANEGLGKILAQFMSEMPREGYDGGSGEGVGEGVQFSLPNEARSFGEAREILEPLAGRVFFNRGSGLAGQLSKNSINKILSGKSHSKSFSLPAHLHAAANIIPLFEGGEVLDSEPGNRGEVKTSHKVFSPFKFDGRVLVAKVTVQEYFGPDANRIYSIEAMEILPPVSGNPADQASSGDESQNKSPLPAAVLERVRDMVGSVNEKKGGGLDFSRPVATEAELIAALDDSEWEVRAYAANNANATEAVLMKALDDSDADVRRAVAENASATEAVLLKAYRDKSVAVQEAVLESRNMTEGLLDRLISLRRKIEPGLVPLFVHHSKLTPALAEKLLEKLRGNPEMRVEYISALMARGLVNVAKIDDATLDGVGRYRRELFSVLKAGGFVPQLLSSQSEGEGVYSSDVGTGNEAGKEKKERVKESYSSLPSGAAPLKQKASDSSLETSNDSALEGESISSGSVSSGTANGAPSGGFDHFPRAVAPPTRKLTEIARRLGWPKDKLLAVFRQAVGAEVAQRWNARNEIEVEALRAAADVREYRVMGPFKRVGVQAIGNSDRTISLWRDDVHGLSPEAFEKLSNVQVASGHPPGFGFVLASPFEDSDGEKAVILTEVQSDVLSVLFDQDKADVAKRLFGEELEAMRAATKPLLKTFPLAAMRNAARVWFGLGVRRVYAITPESMMDVLRANPPVSVVEAWTGEKTAKAEGFGGRVELTVDGKKVEAWGAIDRDSEAGVALRFSRGGEMDAYSVPPSYAGVHKFMGIRCPSRYVRQYASGDDGRGLPADLARYSRELTAAATQSPGGVLNGWYRFGFASPFGPVDAPRWEYFAGVSGKEGNSTDVETGEHARLVSAFLEKFAAVEDPESLGVEAAEVLGGQKLLAVVRAGELSVKDQRRLADALSMYFAGIRGKEGKSTDALESAMSVLLRRIPDDGFLRQFATEIQNRRWIVDVAENPEVSLLTLAEIVDSSPEMVDSVRNLLVGNEIVPRGTISSGLAASVTLAAQERWMAATELEREAWQYATDLSVEHLSDLWDVQSGTVASDGWGTSARLRVSKTATNGMIVPIEGLPRPPPENGENERPFLSVSLDDIGKRTFRQNQAEEIEELLVDLVDDGDGLEFSRNSKTPEERKRRLGMLAEEARELAVASHLGKSARQDYGLYRPVWRTVESFGEYLGRLSDYIDDLRAANREAVLEGAGKEAGLSAEEAELMGDANFAGLTQGVASRMVGYAKGGMHCSWRGK